MVVTIFKLYHGIFFYYKKSNAIRTKGFLLFNSIYKKVFIFILIVIIYYFLDYLNHTRAGKIILLGAFSLMSCMAWSSLYEKSKILKILTVFTIFILFLNMSFHGVLRDIFGIAQDDMVVMKAIFSTNGSEIFEFFVQYKWYLLKHFLLFVIFFCFFLFVAQRKIKYSAKLKKIAIFSTIIFVLMHVNSSLRRSNPLIYFPHYYAKWQKSLQASKKLSKMIKENLSNSTLAATSYVGKDENSTLVWVIGESDTKYNWSLYGYKRDTNPKLNLLKSKLLIFNEINASAPNTILAFERMFTSATKKEPSLWQNTPDILLIAKKAGYHTYWITNHSTDAHGVINIFAQNANQAIFTNRGKSRGEGSFDETVLQPYKEALKQKYKKKFIIVHLLGSHPAYDYRYPKKFNRFTYTLDDEVMRTLKKRGVSSWAAIFRNLYDNSIVYSDFIRYQLLLELMKQNSPNSSWLYVSDHGQDVCHNGNYSGHNYEALEQWSIPMVFWTNKFTCKNSNIVNTKYDLDNVNHTILGLLDINSSFYDATYDIFKQNCK